MTKHLAWGLLAMFLCVSWSSADLVTEHQREQDQKAPPGSIRSYVDVFKANKRAVAVAEGTGLSCLGMYVFDAQGNCVAWDDLTSPQTSDDLIVEWVPAETARYDVEIYNAGTRQNEFQLALR